MVIQDMPFLWPTVAPLMKLAHRISDHGIKITFVNTEFIHEKIMTAIHDKDGKPSGRIELVSIPDGRDPGSNRSVMMLS